MLFRSVMNLTLPFDVPVSDRLRGTLSNAEDAVVLVGAMSPAWYKLFLPLKPLDKESKNLGFTAYCLAGSLPKVLQEVCALLVPKP